MYLKDLKEEVRSAEDDMNDAALSEFARLKSRSEAEAMNAAASMPLYQPPGTLLIAKKTKRDIR